MCSIVVEELPAGRSLRVLDLGCGTGSLVFRLVESLPHAEVTGIDVSAANIRAAEAGRPRASTAARARFARADYLEYAMTPVDAIVSDGVLHLIGGDTLALFRKLAHDLVPGGRLIVCMPYDCAYNYGFAMLRRLLRLVRSRALDAMILSIGRRLHGREMDDEGLRERIPYMYLPPTRLAGRALRESIAPSAGLRVIARHSMRSTSLSQLKHEVIVFERMVA
jgi:SAM-dependent methyltransferase